VIAGRVVNAQQLRINPFAQVAARFRDGAGVSLHGLLLTLTGTPASAHSAPAPRSPLPQRPAPLVAPAPTPREDPVQLLRDAEALAAQGHTAAAVERYRRLLSIQPDNAAARLQLAIGLSLCGEVDAALKQLDELKRMRPADAQIIDTRAVVLAQAGRFDEALGTLDMALMRQPGDWSLMRRRAFVRLKAGPPARAQTELEKLLALQADDAELWVGLAHSLEQQGRLEPAKQALQALLALPAAKIPPRIAAEARQHLAQLQAAGSDAPAPRPAQSPAPQSSTSATAGAAALAYQSGVDCARQGQFDAALPFFLRAAELAPQHARYLMDVGNCLNDLGRPAQARDWLTRSLALDGGSSQAHWLLGVVEEKLGNREAAINSYRQILAALGSEQRWVDRAFDRLRVLGALPG
jgi:protein O-GlcNAc transferase